MNARVLPFDRRGQGAPLVMLHGFTGSRQGLADLSARLSTGFETLVPDLPGHGQATGGARDGRYRFEDCIDDLEATLGATGHERAHWFGYSMGARLALGFALRNPGRVASLSLLGARAGIEEEGEREARRRADSLLAARIERDGIEAFVDEWMALPLFASQKRLGPAFVERMRQARLANDPAELAASLRGCGPGSQPAYFAELSRLHVPVLLMVGELDTQFLATARDLARRLPEAEVRVIEDAGHAAHVEEPAAVAAAIEEFLRRADSRARRPSEHG